jgi:hypothetical protein
MIYTTPEGISALDLATNAAKPVVTGKARVIVTDRRTPDVYSAMSTSTPDNAV